MPWRANISPHRCRKTAPSTLTATSSASCGLTSLAAHGARLFADCEPDAVLSEVPRVRFGRSGAGYCVYLPLPGATADDLEVTVVAGELVVRAGSRRRALILPRRIAPLPLGSARLEDGVLTVAFGPAAASGS